MTAPTKTIPIGCGQWRCETAQAELAAHQAEIKRLNSCLEYEQGMSQRVGTHGPDCWKWGPQHYKCLCRRMLQIEIAAHAVIARWDSIQWKETEPTGEVIYRLRDALEATL